MQISLLWAEKQSLRLKLVTRKIIKCFCIIGRIRPHYQSSSEGIL